MIKRIIFNIVIVAVIVFILDYSIGTFLKTLYFKQTNGDDYRLIYAILKTNEDIIILGDSRAQHHYVPSVIKNELKLSCFNAGRAGGQSIVYHYAIFNSIISRYKPKMFIINIAPYELLEEKTNAQYDKLSVLLPFANTNKTIKQILKLRGPYESLKNISVIYPFNSKLITLLYHNSNRLKDDYGYMPRIGSRPIPMEIKQKLDNNLSDFDTMKLKYFGKLMNEAKINDIRIIIVLSPQFYSLPPNKSTNYIKEYCSRKNIQFIDYSNNITFQKHNEFFNEARHLNNEGAILFTTILAKEIQQNSFHGYSVNTKSE